MARLKKDERICPFCAETIKAAATKCRYCQSDLPPEPRVAEPDETTDPVVEPDEIRNPVVEADETTSPEPAPPRDVRVTVHQLRRPGSN